MVEGKANIAVFQHTVINESQIIGVRAILTAKTAGHPGVLDDKYQHMPDIAGIGNPATTQIVCSLGMKRH
jgi:hypothetical protein